MSWILDDFRLSHPPHDSGKIWVETGLTYTSKLPIYVSSFGESLHRVPPSPPPVEACF
jgi:hypothetical protein